MTKLRPTIEAANYTAVEFTGSDGTVYRLGLNGGDKDGYYLERVEDNQVFPMTSDAAQIIVDTLTAWLKG